MKFNCLSSATKSWLNLVESDKIFRIFSRLSPFSIMAIELPLSNVWVIKFLFLESDFIAANYSGHKFKGAPFSLQEFTKTRNPFSI